MRVVSLLVALSALQATIGSAVEDAPTTPSPHLTLTVEVVRGTVALPRGFEDVLLSVVLTNHSKLAVPVNRRLEEAISIEHVRLQGVPLVPVTIHKLPLVPSEDIPDDPVGPLQPGESIRLEMHGLAFSSGHTQNARTEYTAQRPGHYEVVFKYAIANHAYEKCFRGPLLSGPVTVAVTPAPKR